jgi:hypothetical protein
VIGSGAGRRFLTGCTAGVGGNDIPEVLPELPAASAPLLPPLLLLPVSLSSLSVRPRILSASADLRKELSCSWATFTSPLYMNWSKEYRSSYLTSRRIMIGC